MKIDSAARIVRIVAGSERRGRSRGDGARNVARLGSLCSRPDVRVHERGAFQQDETRSGADDSILFPAADAHHLHYWGLRVSRRGRFADPASSLTCRNLPHPVARRYVYRQRKRCAEGNDTWRQARDGVVAANAHANSVHRADLVGFPLETPQRAGTISWPGAEAGEFRWLSGGRSFPGPTVRGG